jgi:AdoMet-dependent rRNA methyltransferase SPB1
MKEHCSDLRVLNKSDFKAMFHWRTKMQQAITAQKELSKEDDDDDDDDSDDDDEKLANDNAATSKSKNRTNATSDNNDDDDDDDEDEEMIAKEIEEVRLRRQRERKRLKKKEHEKMQKRRKQAALSGNMINMDISNGIQDSIFSLATIPNAKALDAIREVNLDHVTDEDLMINHDATADDDMVVIGPTNEENSDNDDDSVVQREKLIQRERDLEEGYLQYLQTTKNKNNVAGTKLAKRSKKLMREKVMNEIQEDTEMAQIDDTTYDAKVYAKMLQGKGDSDDDDDDDNDSDSDDGYDAEPMTPSEFQASVMERKSATSAGNKSDNQNPLIHQFNINESQSMKTARWFSNPLFAAIGQSVSATTGTTESATAKSRINSNAESDSDDDSDDNTESGKKDRYQRQHSENSKKRKAISRKSNDGKKGNEENYKLSAEEIIASMPKTDKQIRHEKRLKLMERDERKKLKRAQKSGDTENEFQLVANASKHGDDNSVSENEDHVNSSGSKQSLDHLTEAQKARVLEARKLIKAGLGHASSNDMTDASKMKSDDTIELVPQDASIVRPLPIMDDRKYDSENEDYDSDDHAKTLALGTMMLRRSKEKALVDSSYNRYAWNDPSDLPEWFVDDENKHYRPQLPIPPALLAKMKEKMMALSAKPIAKVAEARARKSRRAKMKLAAAKKQAEAVANSNDMSEAMKLKAISKALTSGKNVGSNKKGAGKKYVVAKKGRGNIGGVKGAKVVDKRMKKEKRATDRIEKTKKKGKQNGLTGSKKRRNHK